jgi:ring-1,2-phenylacetyl-CoA epoxidase subunit PaaC
LGDGTEESALRMQAACAFLEPYLGEFFHVDVVALEMAENSTLPDPLSLRGAWLADVNEVFEAAKISPPNLSHAHKGGRQGRHMECMGHLLAQLQYMQRSFPNMTW